MNNKKTWAWVAVIVIIIILIIVFLITSNKNASAPAGKTTITIGSTLPLTGDLAFLGVDAKNSMLMALADAEKSGNLKYNYKINFDDDKFDPTTAVTVVNKFISVDGVDAITSFGSPVGDAVSPITEQNKIVHINSIASDPNVAIGDYNFVHWTPPYGEASLLISEFNKLGLKKVALIEQNQPGVLAVVNALKSQLAGTDIKLVTDQKFDAGETDYRTIIAKAKTEGSNADIWLLEALSPDLEVMATQMKEEGITKPVTSVEAFEFTDKPQLFEGDWFVDSADTQQWFIDEYTKEYNSAPKTGSGNAYDSIKMLISAFEATGNGKTKPSQSSVQQYLASLKGYNGAMGNNLSMDPDGIVVTQATLKMISGGKVVSAQQ